MEAVEEYRCCQERDVLMAKIEEYSAQTEQECHCIVQHPGFRSVCLDQYVLDTAYLQYRQEHGALHNYRPDEYVCMSSNNKPIYVTLHQY